MKPASLFAAALAALALAPPARAVASQQAALTQVEATAPAPRDSKKALNTIAEVFRALEACWIPPDLDESRAGMQITVMVAFKRSGELLGEPRITYETPTATEAERTAYRTAMAQALARCLPLHFTDALGNALAGRPMTLRFIDNRKLKQAGRFHDHAS